MTRDNQQRKRKDREPQNNKSSVEMNAEPSRASP